MGFYSKCKKFFRKNVKNKVGFRIELVKSGDPGRPDELDQDSPKAESKTEAVPEIPEKPPVKKTRKEKLDQGSPKTESGSKTENAPKIPKKPPIKKARKEKVNAPAEEKKRQANSEKLTKAQQEAVDHYEGPALVIAGPGAGKTLVIAKRVENLIRREKPENILVTTFTNKAADELKVKLGKGNRRKSKKSSHIHDRFILQNNAGAVFRSRARR